MIYQETRLAPYARERIYAVVADIERYPEFVPGWTRARVLRRADGLCHVEQEIGLGPVHLSFASRAELRPPEGIVIHTSERPFKRFRIDWLFVQDQGPGCEVRLRVDLELGASLLRPVVEGRFRSAAARLIPLFLARTDALLQGR
jgi:coenzyme Q-binding protein COQ10